MLPRRPTTATPPAANAASADEPVRLNKRMADLGLCSRREADAWIERGWVRVDGVVAAMGTKVRADARITVDRAAAQEQQQRVTILLHKPIGYVSGQAEDGYAPAASLISPRTHWREDASRQRFAPAQLRGLAPAGRLDIDSTGLLVLTQDGRIARSLIGEDSQVEKEYLVRVRYDPTAAPPRPLRWPSCARARPSPPTCAPWCRPKPLRGCATGSRSTACGSSRRGWTGRTPNSCASCSPRGASGRFAACASSSA